MPWQSAGAMTVIIAMFNVVPLLVGGIQQLGHGVSKVVIAIVIVIAIAQKLLFIYLFSWLVFSLTHSLIAIATVIVSTFLVLNSFTNFSLNLQ
jgi:hypothetical protein